MRPGGALGATVGGASAGAAARAWLDRNRALFRLGSLAGLTQVSDSRLAASDTHAITLRQTPGGVAASGGGLVTIGVAKAGSAWKVVSAASTISGDETLASGSAKLSDAQAWQRAAINVGHNTSLARVTRIGTRKLGLPRGWKGLRVAGLSDVQRSRPVAFPTVTRGYVPAFENLVVDTSGVEPSAYRVFVDARSGAVLARENLVDSEGATDSSAAPKARAAQAPAPGTTPLTGALPAQDAGCDTPKGPFTVADGSGVRAIDVFANAENPANDIVLQLFRAGVAAPVAQQDTVRTPERIRYAPEGGVPAGDYTVVVCDFEDGTAPVAPLAWTGTIGLDASAPPAAVHRALARVHGQPAAGAAHAGSVEQPEHRHAREPLLEAEHHAGGLRPRRRQPRVALAVGLRPGDERVVEHDDRQQRPHGRVLDRRRASPGPTSSAR